LRVMVRVSPRCSTSSRSAEHLVLNSVAQRLDLPYSSFSQSISPRLVHRILGLQRKRCDLDIEMTAARADHLIRPPHHTHRGLERAPRRVLERLARREHRLFAHHARTFDFFDVVQRIRDNPVAAAKLNRLRSLIRNTDRILEDPFALLRPRILWRGLRE